MTKPQYFKFLRTDGLSRFQGYPWPIPKDGKPGDWLPPVEGDLKFCVNGYHILRRRQLLGWEASTLWRVEAKGEVLEGHNKCVARQVRLLERVDTWNERNCRLFAADCAERVLPIFEERYPDDDRPRKAIEAARLLADNKITQKRAAAAGAAFDYAGAAGAAVWASALYYGWEAAGYAARTAAWVATNTSERKWQINRLWQYLDGKVA